MIPIRYATYSIVIQEHPDMPSNAKSLPRPKVPAALWYMLKKKKVPDLYQVHHGIAKRYPTKMKKKCRSWSHGLATNAGCHCIERTGSLKPVAPPRTWRSDGG